MPSLKFSLKQVLRVIATLVVVVIAGVLAWLAWQHYVYAPWTRDARVQASVVNVAPQVSGAVIKVAVQDDGYVHKGQLLFQIDPVRFKHMVAEDKAMLEKAKAQAFYTVHNAHRLEKLPPGGVSTQAVQQAQARARSAKASINQSQARLAQAKQNLAWTTVRSPVNGYVTHLVLKEGDYATQGQSKVTLVDADSFRVIAYFQETKMPHINIGDTATIELMAGSRKLHGYIASIGHGIAIANYAPGERNLPSVNPTFQWVRLAQRVPVTIAFDKPPAKLHLTIGQTATVTVHSGQKDAYAKQADAHDRPARHKTALRLSPKESLALGGVRVGKGP